MRKPSQRIVKRDGNKNNPFALNTMIFVFIIKKEDKKTQKTNLLIHLPNKKSSAPVLCWNPDVNNDNNTGNKNKAFYLKEYQALIPIT